MIIIFEAHGCKSPLLYRITVCGEKWDFVVISRVNDRVNCAYDRVVQRDIQSVHTANKRLRRLLYF
ncbi:hypothetical protein D3C85_1735320 [compost metagenome]